MRGQVIARHPCVLVMPPAPARPRCGRLCFPRSEVGCPSMTMSRCAIQSPAAAPGTAIDIRDVGQGFGRFKSDQFVVVIQRGDEDRRGGLIARDIQRANRHCAHGVVRVSLGDLLVARGVGRALGKGPSGDEFGDADSGPGSSAESRGLPFSRPPARGCRRGGVDRMDSDRHGRRANPMPISRNKSCKVVA